MSMTAYDLAVYDSFIDYEFGTGAPHPNFDLGWGPVPDSDELGFWYYYAGFSGNYIGWPINPFFRFGWFRVPNFQVLHKYVNGKFYDPTYYAPNDVAPFTAASTLFDEPYEFVADPLTPYFSSRPRSPSSGSWNGDSCRGSPTIMNLRDRDIGTRTSVAVAFEASSTMQ